MTQKVLPPPLQVAISLRQQHNKAFGSRFVVHQRYCGGGGASAAATVVEVVCGGRSDRLRARHVLQGSCPNAELAISKLDTPRSSVHPLPFVSLGGKGFSVGEKGRT